MKSTIKSKIKGRITAPASKSLTIRAVLSALLANGESKIVNPSFSSDGLAALNAIKQLGANVIIRENELFIISGEINKTNFINCNESGLLIRLLLSISPLLSTKMELLAEGSLKNRKLGNIETVFEQFGIECLTNNDYSPIYVLGSYKQAKKINIDASSSSQILSGLLMALPLLNFDSQINVVNLNSKPYIDLTIDLINKFGIVIDNWDYKQFNIRGNQKYQPINYYVEGDWSGSAFLLTAGAISGGIEIKNLDLNSKQGDKIILDILKHSGANVELQGKTIKVSHSNLISFDFDASNYPDLVPPLTVLGLNCKGISKIKGVHRLINKESNRLQALLKEFGSLGANIELDNDTLIIKKSKLKGSYVSSHNDHRIAMALAIAGLNSDNAVTIDNANCVNKSYPDFFKDLQSIGGIIYE